MWRLNTTLKRKRNISLVEFFISRYIKFKSRKNKIKISEKQTKML